MSIYGDTIKELENGAKLSEAYHKMCKQYNAMSYSDRFNLLKDAESILDIMHLSMALGESKLPADEIENLVNKAEDIGKLAKLCKELFPVTFPKHEMKGPFSKLSELD